MIKYIFTFISRECNLLFTHPYMFYLRRFWCFFLNSILWIKKDLLYRYKDINIKFPNKIGVSYVLMETFVYKIFSEMKWLDKVLDIWWFIWESALYLACYNKEVYCYELSKTNFEYLQKNCKNLKNIHYYNAWISVSDVKYMQYNESLGVDSTIKVRSNASKNIVYVKNLNILTLLKKHKFDGIKLDIEGGEYNIVDSLIKNDKFNFKKWIIEFHFLNKNSNLRHLKQFIKFLLKKRYRYEIFTNEKRKYHYQNYINMIFVIFILN